MTARLRRRDDVLVQRAGETVVLLDPVSGEYYSLDDVGVVVWECADGVRSIGDVVREIASRYEADRETITRDVVELVGELERERLVAVDAS